MPSPDNALLLPTLLIGGLGALLYVFLTPWVVRRHGGAWPPVDPKERQSLRRWDVALLTGLLVWSVAQQEAHLAAGLAVTVLWMSARVDGPTGLLPMGLLTAGMILVPLAALFEGAYLQVVWAVPVALAYAGLGRLMQRRTGTESLGDGDPILLGILIAGLGIAGLAAFWLANGIALVVVLARRGTMTHFGPWLALGIAAESVVSRWMPATASLLRLGL